MAYSITNQSGNVETYLTEFICDTETDILTLPTENCKPGSSCLVIETSNVYILNSEKQWKKI